MCSSALMRNYSTSYITLVFFSHFDTVSLMNTSNSYKIRLMKTEERASVRALMERSFDPSIHAIFFIHDSSTLVAVVDDKIVAGINLDIYTVKNKTVKIGYLGWLYTDSQFRGMGLGSALIDAALEFLKEQKCTDVAGCVEGDNPSSFKQLDKRGFTIMSLPEQLRRFGLGTATVWSHASRFFDMGYFFWHKRLDIQTQKTSSLTPSVKKQAISLVLTCLASIILWIPVLLWTQSFSLFTALFPAFLIATRTLVMKGVGYLLGLKTIFLAWDTAYLAGLILPLLGWPFPVPGGVYPKGSSWSLKKTTPKLALLGASAIAVSLIAVLISSGITLRYAATLLILDTVCFFYPFCGFNGSRIKRVSSVLWGAIVIIGLGAIALSLWII